MQREAVSPRFGTGALELTERESRALDTLVAALQDALRRRLPLSLRLVDFDLELELCRSEVEPIGRVRPTLERR